MNSTATDDPWVHCRAVVDYGSDGPEIVRLSDRVAECGPREGTLELIRSITERTLPSGPFGDHEATVYRFHDVVVVDCPGEDGGSIATFDPDVGDRAIDRVVDGVRSV